MFYCWKDFPSLHNTKIAQVMKVEFSNPPTKLTDSPVVPLMCFLVDIDTFRLSQIIGKSDNINRALDAIPLITHNRKTRSTSVLT